MSDHNVLIKQKGADNGLQKYQNTFIPFSFIKKVFIPGMQAIPLKKRNIENLLYVLIWLFVFSVPFFNQRSFNRIDWHRLSEQWIRLFCYLLIFLVNVYVLVPKLLFLKKYLAYFITVAVIIILVISIDVFIQSIRPLKAIPTMAFPPARPNDFSGDMPPPGPDDFRSNRPPGGPVEFGPEGQAGQRKTPFLIFLDNLIIGILIIGAGMGSKLVSKWLSEEKLRKDIEKEQLKTNLALLRHQVSPHFFMNTLNNIHALIDINTEDAKDAIIRLSTLMRYLLYDSAQPKINLRKEIEFINSFITLMQIRYSDKVNITVVVPEHIPDIEIPPMLFISFLENAFKHGVSYQSPSFIYFEIAVFENSLSCKVNNSKQSTKESQYDEYSGIGLQNIKKSLELLYETNYTLVVNDKEHEFEVNLTIPL